VSPEVIRFLADLRGKITIGFVGGSDLKKQLEQLGPNVLDMFDYCFSENGLTAYKDGQLIGQQSFAKFLGEENLTRVLDWTLHYLSTIKIPVKRGTFIEFRAGMLNISPIGRNCSQEERDAFEKYDETAGVRKAMVAAMKAEFADLGLTFSIGGQISFDVFPSGWDKRFCLQFVTPPTVPGFDEIHFFGDKTMVGGNDLEIFEDPRTIGHTVTSPEDTMQQCKDIFF
jgi:phosphomannomutase